MQAHFCRWRTRHLHGRKKHSTGLFDFALSSRTPGGAASRHSAAGGNFLAFQVPGENRVPAAGSDEHGRSHVLGLVRPKDRERGPGDIGQALDRSLTGLIRKHLFLPDRACLAGCLARPDIERERLWTGVETGGKAESGEKCDEMKSDSHGEVLRRMATGKHGPRLTIVGAAHVRRQEKAGATAGCDRADWEKTVDEAIMS